MKTKAQQSVATAYNVVYFYAGVDLRYFCTINANQYSKLLNIYSSNVPLSLYLLDLGILTWTGKIFVDLKQ